MDQYGPGGGETVKNERIYRTSLDVDIAVHAWADCDSIGVMNQVTNRQLEGSIAVRDGRRLGFAEFGSPSGPAIIWMHGTPGARRQIPVEARAYADREGLRIIGVDRPGIGSSTPHVYESVLDWTEDLAMVADTLGIDKMHLIGLSGVAPTSSPPAPRCPTGCSGWP